MDHIHLSKRLQAIRAFIEPNERLADIGTDHAFLPIDLVQRGIIKFKFRDLITPDFALP